jgi:hypothetical protein
MDLAAALFEEGVVQECAEVGGHIADGYEYGKSKDKARAAVSIGSGMIGGAVAEGVLAGAAAEGMLAGAAVGGPIGMVIGLGASIAAASFAKTVYDNA